MENSVKVKIEKTSNEERTQGWSRSISKDWGVEYARYQQEMGCNGEHMSKCSKESTWRKI